VFACIGLRWLPASSGTFGHVPVARDNRRSLVEVKATGRWASAPNPVNRRPPTGVEGLVVSAAAQAQAGDSSSTRRLRVREKSSGMPGPMVVEIVALVMYRPFDAAGLSRRTSSSAVA
jgi:hypothetical protein